MLKTVIIADDLTGANDTGAIIAQDGFKVGTVLDTNKINQFKEFDVLCISTDSRGIAKEDAYKRVASVANLFKNKKGLFISKRCDSTLRGNVGIEIDSILDSLGENAIAIVVASFPDSGRTCIGDYLLVHDVPLEKTEVAKDAVSPVNISRVTEIVKKQSRFNVGYIPLSKVLQGADAVKSAILKAAPTYRIIVIDARTNEDIKEIAKGCIATKLKIVAIDPGAFTACMNHELYSKTLKSSSKSRKMLLGIGSASSLTRKQVKALKEKYNPLIVKTDTPRFFDKSTREDEINRVVQKIISEGAQSDILTVVTTVKDTDVVDFATIKGCEKKSKGECAAYLAKAIAEIIFRIKSQLGNEIGGLYISGGDISTAFCEKVKAVGFDVQDEVVPLAIYSKLLGGAFDQTPIITKGGLVGDDTTLITCVDYLRNKISGFSKAL